MDKKCKKKINKKISLEKQMGGIGGLTITLRENEWMNNMGK